MRKLLAVAALASLIVGAQVTTTPATAAPRSEGVGVASSTLLQEAHYAPRQHYHAPPSRQHYAPPRYQAQYQPYWHRHPAPPRFGQRHPGHWR